MSYAGPARPVGSPATDDFNFNRYVESVNVQIRFFSDAEGLVPIAAGLGTATLTAAHSATMWRGTRSSPEKINSGNPIVSSYTGLPVAATAGVWQEFAFGGGSTSVQITPSAIVAPPGAVTYSIVVDVELRS